MLPASAKTAKVRTKLSAPMAYLYKQELLVGRCLDYGCGRGIDTDLLNHVLIRPMYKYDPYWSPYDDILRPGFFDTITCHYVLNVIESEYERQTVLYRLQSMLRLDGKAYITVRADVKEDGFTKRGNWQGNIFLDLPLLKTTKSFRMYVLA